MFCSPAGSVPALPAVVQGEGRLPDGVPDVLNPGIRASRQPNVPANLEGDPDFAAGVYVNVSDNGDATLGCFGLKAEECET